MKKDIFRFFSILITSILMFNFTDQVLAGGEMSKKNQNIFYTKLLKIADEKKWVMLTDSSRRTEQDGYKKTFSLSFFNDSSKEVDINLFTPKEWPHKNLSECILSPDASYIAFIITDHDPIDGRTNYGLYIISLNDLNIKTIFSPNPFPNIGSLCWSPDGKKLFFVGKLTDIKEPEDAKLPQFDSLYSLDLETKKIDMLVQYNVLTINSQACSSDGSEIVFEDADWEVSVYNSKTNSIQKIAKGDWATWMPNSKKIAFKAKDGSYYFINPDGTNKELFIKNSAITKGLAELKPSGEKIWAIGGELLWSPDGQYVYFERSATDSIFATCEYYIPYVMDVATKQEMRLPDNFIAGITSWAGEK